MNERRRAVGNLPQMVTLEAHRLLAIALSLAHEDLTQDEAVTVEEIRHNLVARKIYTTNPLAQRALQLHAENKQKSLKRLGSSKLLEKARNSLANDQAVQDGQNIIEEVRNAILDRRAHASTNEEVNNALDEHLQTEKMKIKFLDNAYLGKCGELQAIINSGLLHRELSCTRGNGGNTALGLAVCGGSREAVSTLLQSNIKSTTYNNDGLTPLDLALDPGMVALLKERDAERGNEISKARLFDAVAFKNLNELRERLKTCSPYMKNGRGETLLAQAVKTNSLELVKVLVEEYFVCVNTVMKDPTVPMSEPMTALDHATGPDIVRYLRGKNALRFWEIQLRQQMISSIREKKKEGIQKILDDQNQHLAANDIQRLVNAFDDNFETLLSYAVDSNSYDCAELLIEKYGADLNRYNYHLKTRSIEQPEKIIKILKIFLKSMGHYFIFIKMHQQLILMGFWNWHGAVQQPG